MATIVTDVAGKLRNLKLSQNDGVLAVFEATMNAIHAIEDRKCHNGKVTITLKRAKEKSVIGDNGLVAPIQSIEIKDNGIGFDENNFKSFLKSESTYKAARGGKGVGRFTWLKVFDYVIVESTYLEQIGEFKMRIFRFENSDNPISSETIEDAPAEEVGTIIKLCGINSEYINSFPIHLENIADQVISHHLVSFVDKSCPEFVIVDEDFDGNSIQLNLNKRFQNDFLIDTDADSFVLENIAFEVAFVRLKALNLTADHKLFLCANDRVVTTDELKKYFPDMYKPVYNTESGLYYNLYVLVKSVYLDHNVNNERTQFILPEKEGAAKSYLISLEEIRNLTVESIYNFLEPDINSIRKEKLDHIQDYVLREAPQYRSLLKFQKHIDKVKPGLSSDKLDLELHKIKNKISEEAKKQLNGILKIDEPLSDPDRIEEYKKNFSDVVAKVNAVGQTDLADYVIHRKLILSLFEKILSKKENGEYEYESQVHNLLFPMKNDSESIDYNHQNLWIIDEKLSYHKFLASDLPLHENKQGKDGSRPDILVGFDKPVAYIDKKSSVYSSMVIVEFKRPMRNYYSANQDPVQQVINYVEEIQDGKAFDPAGRPINVTKNCKFFAYIICDITDKIQSSLRRYSFQKTADEAGYFHFNTEMNVYFEVISYDKMLMDSQQRNQILFDKLGIKYS
ncbi:hypothetical protein EFA69_10500 [Rufibacter immobilis]|uniref:ATP-binding protein n=1 Tax=Rufibacter immobilis TaxID=1348778 RepID=A0A3M9MYW7_9BACT|nr:ATP-binding protein [Rufibacter immobilis]RNI29948.1 hypothetical protein EFA69_10500 [Rufibacter immobilis]